MNLRETIELIQETAQEAKKPKAKLLPVKANSHETRLLMPDGKVEIVKSDPPVRRHTVYDIESLAQWTADDKEAHVWHCDTDVVLVLDDGEHRENTVTMPLPTHPKFDALDKQTGQNFNQKSLIDFLRLNLKEEVEQAHPGFIALLRKINCRSSDSGTSEITVGRESMGREVEDVVAGVTDFPEDLAVHVPMWLHLDLVVVVHVAFDVNVSDRTFMFRPKPGAIQQARVNAQKWLHEQLAAACDSSPIFFGKP